MNRKRKSNIIMICLVIAIILVIMGIEYLQGDWFNGQDQVLRCIAKSSTLYVSKTCSHCAEQKLILGDGLRHFEIVDCLDTPSECQDINRIPTWKINGEYYVGKRTIEQLKELTGC